MNLVIKIAGLLWWLLIPSLVIAQCTGGTSDCPQAVPHLVKFNGVVRDSAGKPGTGTVGMMFSVYSASTGGIPLWQETQNVQLDSQGRYAILLGAATIDGIPPALFQSGDPRWLGVQVLMPGEVEQPRVLLVSVPYALRAGDAQTLGGLPASAFMKLPATASVQGQAATSSATAKAGTSSTVAMAAAAPAATEAPVTTPGGSANTIPKFSVSPSIVDSQITDVNGLVSMQNLGNILFADRFSDGVPGAIAACPAEGCTIYAGAESVNRNLGTIDPGNKLITIYLGPFTYNVKQIFLRKSLRIIGMGASTPGTILQSVNGNDPVVVLPQVNVPVTNVYISGLRIEGSVGNTSEDAFFLDSSSLSNSGLWYSELNDLFIEGFAGIGLHLRGPNANFGAETQWVQFNNIVVTRNAGGGNAVRIEGANFQLHFTTCEFEGQAMGDGTNVYIGGFPGGNFSFPFDITFRGTVSEGAAVAFQIDGAASIRFEASHHEQVWGAYLISGNNDTYTRGVTITDSVFNPNVGVHNGAGFLLNVATTLAQGIYFVHNRLGGVLGGVSAPDSVVTAMNLSQVVYQDNEYFGSLNVPPTSGITTQISAASTINIGGAHTIGINPDPSGTPITTIQSTLGPGEMVTFAALGGSVTFATGGNIGLPGANAVTVPGTITFIRNDLTGAQSQWWPVSQWSASSAPGFTLSTPQTSATVRQGETATYPLTLIPTGGFLGSVQFSCLAAPKATNCIVLPNPLVISGNFPVTARVAIATAPTPVPAPPSPLPPWQLGLGQMAGSTLGMLLLVRLGISGQDRHRRRRNTLLLGLLALLIPSLGCGSLTRIASPGVPTPPVTSPPAKTYAVVITGVSGDIHQSITLTLNVM
jgi:hypothetical protein